MNLYAYVGDLDYLKGHTALGQWLENPRRRGNEWLMPGFYVQVNDTTHLWAHHWHRTNHLHWRQE